MFSCTLTAQNLILPQKCALQLIIKPETCCLELECYSHYVAMANHEIALTVVENPTCNQKDKGLPSRRKYTRQQEERRPNIKQILIGFPNHQTLQQRLQHIVK